MPFQVEYECSTCCAGVIPRPCICPECEGVMVDAFTATFGTTTGCALCEALNNQSVTLVRTPEGCSFEATYDSLILILVWNPVNGWVLNINEILGFCDEESTEVADAYHTEDFTCNDGGIFNFFAHSGGASEACGEFDVITLSPVAVFSCQDCCLDVTIPSTLVASISPGIGDPCDPLFEASYDLVYNGTSWVFDDALTEISLTCDSGGTWTLVVIHDGVTFTHGSEPDSSSCDPFSQVWGGVSGDGCTLESITITE